MDENVSIGAYIMQNLPCEQSLSQFVQWIKFEGNYNRK